MGISNKEFFKGLRACKSEAQLGTAQSVPKKEKLRVLMLNYILEKNQPCILSLCPLKNFQSPNFDGERIGPVV